ncbi:MAG TPA: PA14 domain-containing protein, partial [Chthonomonadaceae bacterium]|nr:PA14 domain-containing protein [Chthonomonadaceae bacterium]
VNGVLTFDPLLQFQRSALALVNNVVYVAFAAHCDITPYHGWIFGYRAGALQQPPYVWVTTPNGKTDASGYPIGGGGVWQAGQAPATDGQNLFFATGNGTFDADPSLGSGIDYGDSVVRLTPGRTGLALKDFFTPYNQNDLNDNDWDLGSGGCLALPASVGSATHPQLLVCCGKTGTIYLMDRANLGHFNTGGNDSQIVQFVPNAVGGVWGSPAYFNGSLYYGGVGDALKAFSIGNAQLSTTPTSQSSSVFGYPGAIPAVSASGTAKGVVWAAESSGSGAVLHAFDATDLATELYNSTQAGARDSFGWLSTFMPPTIANDKVYVPTWNQLSVFGSSVWTAQPQVSPAGGFYDNSVTVSISDSTQGAALYYTTDGSTPTTSSTPYTGSFTLTNCAPVKVLAVSPLARPSGVSETDYVVGIPPANGTGLTGTYYAGLNFTGNTYTEVDPTINFNWNGGSPAPGIPGTNWSARWTGTIEPQCTTTYAFYTYSDDGVRVWINGVEIINDWTNHAPTWDEGSIALTAGQSYSIKIEYFQGTGGSLLQFYWAPDYLDPQIVPQSQLFPSGPPLP